MTVHLTKNSLPICAEYPTFQCQYLVRSHAFEAQIRQFPHPEELTVEPGACPRCAEQRKKDNEQSITHMTEAIARLGKHGFYGKIHPDGTSKEIVQNFVTKYGLDQSAEQKAGD